ncbi:MAG: glycosyltransferase [Candidatus Levybacteria bacterium]|nr:glycosyltransferase [Candidatus Levybacteria bacterium]
MTKNVVISSHVLLPGASHALRDYIIKKGKVNLLFISLPLITQEHLFVENYTNGKKELKDRRKKINLNIIEYIYELVYILWFSIIFSKKIDVFFGVDPLNAFAGLILKRFGKVSKVVFYGIDFVPKRFENNVINALFHFIEKIVVKQSDEVWNVSPRIAEGRRKYLKIDDKKFLQKTVPIGIDKITRKKSDKVNYKMIFIGHLLEKQGLQLVIDALPNILMKVPDLKLIIIGGGEFENVLKGRVRSLKLGNTANFLGWIQDRKIIANEMMRSDIGIACYKPEKDRLTNFTYYADPTKIKDYLSFGLPVLTTNVPYNAREISSAGCGFVVEYRKESIEKVIIGFYKNRSQIAEKKKQAYLYIEKSTWKRIFDKATNEII